LIEEKEYAVHITVDTIITFSPIERATPITKADAIANAMSLLPASLWHTLEYAGFSVCCEADEL